MLEAIPMATSALAAHPKEWVGENYHNNSQMQYALAKNLLKHCSFMGHEKILDVGCGSGRIAAEIATQVLKGSVVGVDFSESMIGFANRTYSPENYKNLRFEIKDAAALEYREEFDAVFSFCCLHWVKNQEAALQNIYCSLKPGGHFLAVIPYARHLERISDAMVETEQWKSYFVNYVRPSNCYELAEYDQLLQGAHFCSGSVGMRETSLVFKERAELLEWVRQLLHELQYLSLELQEVFLNQYIDALLVQFPHPQQSSGAIHIPLPVLEVKARKLLA